MPILQWTFADGEVLSASHLNAMIAAIDSNTLGVQDISSRITSIPDLLALKELIFYKGEVTVAQLTNLPKESSYSIYKLVDTQSNILEFQVDFKVGFENNSYIVCTKDFTQKLTQDNFYEYWAIRTGFYEKATGTREGIVSTEYQEYGGLKTFLNGIEVRGTLDLKDGKLLVTDDEGLKQIVSIPPNLNTKLDSYDEEIEKLWNEINKTKPEEDLPEHIKEIWKELADIRSDFTKKDSYLEGLITAIQDDLMTVHIELSSIDSKLTLLEETVNAHFEQFNDDLLQQIANLEKNVNHNISALDDRMTLLDETITGSLTKLSSDYYNFKEEITTTVNENYSRLYSKIKEVDEQQIALNNNVNSNKEELTEKYNELKRKTNEELDKLEDAVDIVNESFATLNNSINTVSDELEAYKVTNNNSVGNLRKQVTSNASAITKIEDNYPVKVLTQGEYNNIPVKKASTIYFIVEYGEAKRLYIGKNLIARKLEGNNFFDYTFPIIF